MDTIQKSFTFFSTKDFEYTNFKTGPMKIGVVGQWDECNAEYNGQESILNFVSTDALVRKYFFSLQVLASKLYRCRHGLVNF